MESTITPTDEQYLYNTSDDYNWTGLDYEEADFETTDDLPASVTIWKVIPSFLIVLGSIGNILIIAVLIRSINTTGMFLCALAASDLIGLYVGLFPEWLMHLTGINHHQSGNFLCKVLPWIKYSVLDYSAWTLVAVTAERVIAVCFPHRNQMMCTRRSAVGYLFASGIVLIVVNAHVLYGFEYTEQYDPNYGIEFHCALKPESYERFFYHVWTWIDVIVYCLIPFTAICVGNCVILCRVRSSFQRSMRSRNVSVGAVNTTRPLPRRKGKKMISELTVTLLLANSAFFVSTFPICVFIIAERLSKEYFQDAENLLKIEIWWVFVYNFMYLNNTCNVFIYCLSGSKFRRDVLALFWRIRTFRLSTSGESFRARQTGRSRSTDKDFKDTKTSPSTRDTPDGQTNLTEDEDEL